MCEVVEEKVKKQGLAKYKEKFCRILVKKNNNHVIVLDNLSTGKLANIAHHFPKQKQKEKESVFEDLSKLLSYFFS